MKINFEIDWDNPDDRRSLSEILKGPSYRSIVADMAIFLRAKNKYESDSHHEKAIEAYELAKEELWGLCKCENVDPFEE